MAARIPGSRTPEQTALALFYTDNFTTLWERTLRGVAAAHTTNIGDSGRMFALANMAAADAIITAWTDKRGFHFWRPITAIQNGDTDGNPRTAGDPTWTPYLVTPPYPEYTSGANNLTSSMTRVLEHLFGDKTEFSVFARRRVSPKPTNGSQTWLMTWCSSAFCRASTSDPRTKSRDEKESERPTGRSATSCVRFTENALRH